jgi:hypothetical protein
MSALPHYNDLSFLGDDAPNVDHATGIRFGVIHSNCLSSDAIADIQDNGEDLTYAAAAEDAKAQIRSAMSDCLEEIIGYRTKSALDSAVAVVWESISQDYNDGYDPDGSTYLYESGGYKITLCADGDLFVELSPYYALRGLCSPCAPNAGHLNTDGEYRTYCLAPDWYMDTDEDPDGDRPDFDIYNVADGTIAYAADGGSDHGQL